MDRAKRNNSRTRRSRVLAFVDALEGVANGVNDSDREWWPFAFLRPKEEEPLTTARVALMALLYGVPVSFLMLIADARTRRVGTADRQLLFVGAVCVAILVLYRLTFAYFWNRRAARLAELAQRRRMWKAGQAPPY